MTTDPQDRPEIIRKRAKVILVQSLWKWFISLIVVAVLTLVVIDTLQGRAVRQELLDCTTPEGDCYKDGQKRTAKVVDQLYQQGLDREAVTRRIIILGNTCSDIYADLDDVVACVNERLKKTDQIKIP